MTSSAPSGQILGAHCKDVLEELLASVPETQRGECSAQLAPLTAEDWYALEQVVGWAQALKALLPDAALSSVGSRASVKALAHGRRQGLKTAEQFLRGLDDLIRGALKDPGPAPAVHVLDLGSGHVLMETPLRFPPAFLLGALRGVLLGFEHTVTSESVMRTGRTTRLQLTWR